ncbi:alpha/beta fold hydrolase [Salmonirosea aquatica]|uniref:Alpha/beta fold hydrolase n=1 Tax=Salmonirosea aquatica TaxID=2654236 RepID=A0A7C9FQ45_9BACT|nr:alpha/beta fold hydrolase [Cytophagaceae bacterium SJW1-29]
MNKLTLHCDRLGQGPNILLAFHGAGQTGHACYDAFAVHLGDYYTLYAFDLFFHGQSHGLSGKDDFSDDDILTKVLWKNFIQDFITTHTISRFDVAGFSLGGRYALATAEAFPELTDRLLLMAPDGVVEHPLYALATRFAPARWIFRQLVRNPRPLFAVAETARRLRIIPKNLLYFIRYMLDTPEERKRLYRTWVSLRELSFSIGPLQKVLEANGVEMWLFAGKYDTLFPPERLKVLSKLLPPARFVILECGHNHLVERAAAYLDVVRASRPS